MLLQVLIGCWAIYKKVVKPILGAVDIVQAIQSGDWDLNWTLPDDETVLVTLGWASRLSPLRTTGCKPKRGSQE